MPLSINLDRLNEVPSVKPCLDGKELRLDSEIVNAALSAISVKGYEVEDRQKKLGISHRNSFWSVHRPELSKLNWASNCTTRDVEEHLRVEAGNQFSHEELNNFDIPSTDFDLLNTIHSYLKQNAYTDDKYLLISKPKTTQFRDDDLAAYTSLRNSRAEFCVTIGHLEEPSLSDTIDDFSLNNAENNIGFGFSDVKVETNFRLEPTVSKFQFTNENELTIIYQNKQQTNSSVVIPE